MADDDETMEANEEQVEEQIDELSELGPEEQLAALVAMARLDLEAAAAYDVASAAVTDDETREVLAAFRDDHLRHVEALNRVVKSRGGKPVDEKASSNQVLPGLAATASAVGDDLAVMALLGNEQLTNRSYEILLEVQWDDEVRALIERTAQDEQRHLSWLAEAEDEMWESAAEGGDRADATLS